MAVGTGGIHVVVGNHSSFTLHADADNTDTILIALDLQSALANNNTEELTPGQSINFVDFTGEIFAASEAGTQTLNVFGLSNNQGTEVIKS